MATFQNVAYASMRFRLEVNGLHNEARESIFGMRSAYVCLAICAVCDMVGPTNPQVMSTTL